MTSVRRRMQKIDIEVGRRYALGIQEALEEQLEAERMRW